MSAVTPPPTFVDLTTSFGYLTIGLVFACVLWGICCMQMFIYFAEYQEDSKTLKTLVASLWIADTASVVLLITGLWAPLLSQWGNFAILAASPPDILHKNWIAEILSTSVQFFFTWRIYRLAAHGWQWIIPPALIFSGLYQLATGIAFSVIGLIDGTLEGLATPRMKTLQISNRALTVLSDIVICVSLLSLLLKSGLPGFKRSRQMLFRLVIVTINSGLWTSIFAFISLMLMITRPQGTEYTVVELPIGSLYLATLLSNLNSRKYVRGRRTEWNEYLSAMVAANGEETQGEGTNRSIILSRLRNGSTTFNQSQKGGEQPGLRSKTNAILVDTEINTV